MIYQHMKICNISPFSAQTVCGLSKYFSTQQFPTSFLASNYLSTWFKLLVWLLGRSQLWKWKWKLFIPGNLVMFLLCGSHMATVFVYWWSWFVSIIYIFFCWLGIQNRTVLEKGYGVQNNITARKVLALHITDLVQFLAPIIWSLSTETEVNPEHCQGSPSPHFLKNKKGYNPLFCITQFISENNTS